MSKGAKNSVTVVACPDYGEGTDPEALRLAFHHQGPTFINAYMLSNLMVEVKVMICVCQGGQRSLSTSSSLCLKQCSHYFI